MVGCYRSADGGLDLQRLGIGRNGHIGFNEPTAQDGRMPCDYQLRTVNIKTPVIDSEGENENRARPKEDL